MHKVIMPGSGPDGLGSAEAAQALLPLMNARQSLRDVVEAPAGSVPVDDD